MDSRTPSTSSNRPSPTASTSSSATPRPRSGSRSRSTPPHPILEPLRIRAKGQACNEYTAKKALKLTRIIGKPLTKRQESNKKSAMICRATNIIYTRLLEAEILQREEGRLQSCNDKLAQTAETVELRRRIRNYEIRLAEDDEKRCVFNTRHSIDDIQVEDQFIPPMLRLYGWECDGTLTQNEASNHGDEESEIARSMDFLLGYPTDSEITYIEGDAMSTVPACKGAHTSPVAFSETAVEVPKGGMVQPAIGK